MVDEGQLISFVERSPTGNLFFSGEVGLFLLKLFEIAEDVFLTDCRACRSSQSQLKTVSLRGSQSQGSFKGQMKNRKGLFLTCARRTLKRITRTESTSR